MGSSMESVRVTIFGSEYSVKSDTDIETTRQIAHFVNSKMMTIQEQSSLRDNMKIAVLSALNIAGELFEVKARHDESVSKIKELEEKIASLSNKIDGVL
jgi:cell division protein ZapA